MASKQRKVKAKKTQADIHQEVTSEIIQAIDSADLPPWRRGFTPANLNYDGPMVPHNLSSKHTYNGVNFILTLIQSLTNMYSTNAWMTFNQAKKMDGSVNKGEKGTRILFRDFIIKDTLTDEIVKKTELDYDTFNPDRFKRIFFLKQYVVFNADQVSGIDAKLGLDQIPANPIEPTVLNERYQRIAQALEEGARNAGVEIHFLKQCQVACYLPDSDLIRMPPMELYESPTRFLETLAHEIAHSTMKPLEREALTEIGIEVDVREEIIAELTSAMLLANLGVPFELSNKACYIDSHQQRQALEADPKLIFECAKQADFAVQYIMNDDLLMKIRQIDEELGITSSDEAMADNDASITFLDATNADQTLDIGSISIDAASQRTLQLLSDPNISDEDAFAQVLAIAKDKLSSLENNEVASDSSESVTQISDKLESFSTRADNINPDTNTPDANDDAFNVEAFLKVYANTPEDIKVFDVLDILNAASGSKDTENNMNVVADYLCIQRPDLATEVQECMTVELSVPYEAPKIETPALSEPQEDLLASKDKSANQVLADFLKI